MTSNQPRPRSGDDTYDLIDDALAALAERRKVWLGDDLTVIAVVTSLIRQAEGLLPHVVHDARANGAPGTRSAKPSAPAPTTHNCAS